MNNGTRLKHGRCPRWMQSQTTNASSTWRSPKLHLISKSNHRRVQHHTVLYMEYAHFSMLYDGGVPRCLESDRHISNIITVPYRCERRRNDERVRAFVPFNHRAIRDCMLLRGQSRYLWRKWIYIRKNSSKSPRDDEKLWKWAKMVVFVWTARI